MDAIRINIRGTINLKLEDLNPFQEDIKVLTEEGYQAFKEEILQDGFSFSPHIFLDGEGKAWILDGHQRRTTLERMKGEGYEIPIIPCMEVEAENLEHARRLVLGAASQYGTFKVTKVLEFTKKTGIDVAAAVSRFALPAVRLGRMTGVDGHERKLPAGSKEFSEGEFTAYDHKCPKCNFEFNDESAE